MKRRFRIKPINLFQGHVWAIEERKWFRWFYMLENDSSNIRIFNGVSDAMSCLLNKITSDYDTYIRGYQITVLRREEEISPP